MFRLACIALALSPALSAHADSAFKEPVVTQTVTLVTALHPQPMYSDLPTSVSSQSFSDGGTYDLQFHSSNITSSASLRPGDLPAAGAFAISSRAVAQLSDAEFSLNQSIGYPVGKAQTAVDSTFSVARPTAVTLHFDAQLGTESSIHSTDWMSFAFTSGSKSLLSLDTSKSADEPTRFNLDETFVLSAGHYSIGYSLLSRYADNFSDNGARGGFSLIASPVAAVPEPATCAMLALGLGLLGFARRRDTRNC